MVTITTKREVPIGHRLLGHNGRCAYLHGHNYTFEVSVMGIPNEIGLVIDFKDVKKALDELLDDFDHAMILNKEDPSIETLKLERLVVLSVNPSAENLASLVFNHLFERLSSPTAKIVRVLCRETEDGWAAANKTDPSVFILAVH